MRTPSISVLIIFIDLTFVLIIRSSKITPSFFTIKEGSTFLTKPLFPQEREDVTALRCSEPLRSKVGGPSKVFASFCGMGPPGAFPIIKDSVSLWSRKGCSTSNTKPHLPQEQEDATNSTITSLKF